MTKESTLFTPYAIGPLTLPNRAIRSAAFEGMCPGNNPSKMLTDYHMSVAAGGIGMTTVAYAAVCRSGLSFAHQLWIRKEAIPELRVLTEAVQRGSCHFHSIGSLWRHVEKESSWLYAAFTIRRAKHLFPYLVKKNDKRRYSGNC